MTGLLSRSRGERASVADAGRTMLFVSYATEDAAFVDWLVLKLTALGYAVWCDRFELLGGESYPRDIDHAIKDRSFRVLAVMSHSSLTKANPVKERTLALNIARERGLDFLIPLNLDVRPSEIDWMQADLSYISFSRSWADGMQHLLAKLHSIAAPRPYQGSDAVAKWFGPRAIAEARQERLWSNLLPVTALPTEVFRVAGPDVASSLPRGWPAIVEADLAWLLEVPPNLVFDMIEPHRLDNEAMSMIDPRRRIVVHLLALYVRLKCVELGLSETDRGRLYFPSGLLPDDRLSFTNYTGRKTHLQAVGFKTFRTRAGPAKNRHHLTIDLTPRIDRYGPPALELRLGVHVTGPDGERLPPKTANARRKAIAKHWFNHQWWSRYRAATRFVLGEEDMVLGLLDHPIARISAPQPITVDFGIDESEISDDLDEDVLLDDELVGDDQP